jgi:hypothetical protein
VTLAITAEQVTIQLGRAVEVADLDGDAEQLGDAQGTDRFVTEPRPGERQICLVVCVPRSPSHPPTTRRR